MIKGRYCCRPARSVIISSSVLWWMAAVDVDQTQDSYRKLDKKSSTFLGLCSTKFKIFFKECSIVIDSDF